MQDNRDKTLHSLAQAPWVLTIVDIVNGIPGLDTAEDRAAVCFKAAAILMRDEDGALDMAEFQRTFERHLFKISQDT